MAQHPWPPEYIPDPSHLRHRSIPSLSTSASGLTITAANYGPVDDEDMQVPPVPPSHLSVTPDSPGHRHIPSLVTNASGIAESTISTWTSATDDGDVLRLSQFPPPPTEIPTPTRSHFGSNPGTPLRSQFTSIPGTPLRGQFGSSPGTPEHKLFSSNPGTPVRSQFNDSNPDTPIRGQFPGSPTSSAFRLGTPPHRDPAAAFSRQGSPIPIPRSRSFDLSPPPNLHGHTPSSPLRAAHSTLNDDPPSSLPDPAALLISPFEWHEASSSISVNSSEENLLSTDFITALLTSTQNHSSNRTSGQEEWAQRWRATLVPSYQSVRTSFPVVHNDEDRLSMPISPWVGSEGGRSSSASGRTSSEHLQSDLDHTIVRTASRVLTRGGSLGGVDGAEGHTVLGIAAATFRTLSGASQDIAGSNIGINGDATDDGDLQRHSAMSSPPPSHRPDAPHSVSGHTEDGNEGSDYRRSGAMSSGVFGGSESPVPPLPSPFPFTPALPSTAGSQMNFNFGESSSSPRPKERRMSTVTNKTTKSYVSSLISRLVPSISYTGRSSTSSKPPRSWWRRKPLPPVPGQTSSGVLPHYDTDIKNEKVLCDDGGKPPLSEPQEQSQDLTGALRRLSQHAWRSEISQPSPAPQLYQYDERYINGAGDDMHSTRAQVGSVYTAFTNAESQNQYKYSSPYGQSNSRPAVPVSPWQQQQHARNKSAHVAGMRSGSIRKRYNTLSSRMKKIALGVVLTIVVVAAAIAVALAVENKKHQASQLSCSGNFTGEACDLDATCVCTSSSLGECAQLAQALVSLTPIVNKLFDESFTPNGVSNAVWAIQGSPTGSNCAAQAKLIDVAPALESSTSPNRTQWAQAALLWNLVLSQDANAVASMQSFVRNADWKSLSATDGRVADPSGNFNVSASGYVFDFAAQTVTMPPVTFLDNGNPSTSQLAEIGMAASNALDRMYTYALAASTQRQSALATYWQTVLQQKPSDLAKFLSAVTSSPILLPFDVTSSPGGQAVASLLSNSTTDPFPPPLSCYPGLSSSQLMRISAIETNVFGLSPPSLASEFNISCYVDRPVYGVLDVLRLRLPFTDPQTGVAKQAITLNSSAYPRAILYNGQVLSALPGVSDLAPLNNSTTDPRQYGTTNHIDHILLNFLTSISDVSVTTELIEYLLTFPNVPPSNSSTLFTAIASIPSIEVAVFGLVTPRDIVGTVSSLSTPTGALFFGSSQSAVFRDWALIGTTTDVLWTEYATSPLIVHDDSLTDSTFNMVWSPAYTFFHAKTDSIVLVSNITQAFQYLGCYTPN